ncbi:hypothetical protein MTO96_036488 [Rhipicephalus appendiculatus]
MDSDQFPIFTNLIGFGTAGRHFCNVTRCTEHRWMNPLGISSSRTKTPKRSTASPKQSRVWYQGGVTVGCACALSQGSTLGALQKELRGPSQLPLGGSGESCVHGLNFLAFLSQGISSSRTKTPKRSTASPKQSRVWYQEASLSAAPAPCLKDQR